MGEEQVFYLSLLGMLKIQLKNHKIYSISKFSHHLSSPRFSSPRFSSPRFSSGGLSACFKKNQLPYRGKKLSFFTLKKALSDKSVEPVRQVLCFLDDYFSGKGAQQASERGTQQVKRSKQTKETQQVKQTNGRGAKQVKRSKQTKETKQVKQANGKGAQQANGKGAQQAKELDLLLFCRGSLFQRKIRRALRKIPYGETRTYAETAVSAGYSARYSRAVGLACARNPFLILVPCHRVTAKTSLGGFALGLSAKKKLLTHEKKHKNSINGNKIRGYKS